MNFDRIIMCLTGEPNRELCQRRTRMRKELVPMVTYGDLFQFVIMLCAVITLVIIATHKK